MPIQDGIVAFDAHGMDRTGQCSFYPGGSGGDLHYSVLNLHDPTAFESQRRTLSTGETILVRFRNATTTRDGQSVTVEGWNATEYRPINPALNNYLGNLIQLNLAPLFDPSAANQAFERLFHAFLFEDAVFSESNVLGAMMEGGVIWAI